jgi:APA family basic amino acid/polyamine antiporter
MANLTLETWWRFLAWLVIGLLVYGGYGYRHSRLNRPAAVTAEAAPVAAGRPAGPPS